MPSHNKRVRIRTPEAGSLVKAFEKIGIIGVRLCESDSDGKLNTEPLQAAISELRSAPITNGPFSTLLEAFDHYSSRKRELDEDENLWKTLESENIAIETVTELIHILAEEDTSPLSIAASEVYFSMLLVPGAFMYHAYNALIFRACISTLKKWISVVGDNQPKKKKKVTKTGSEMQVDEEVDDDGSQTANASIGETPVSAVIDCLKHLSKLAHKVPLSAKSEGFMALLEVAVEMSKMTGIVQIKLKSGKSGSVSLIDKSDKFIKEICDESYDILEGLVSNVHGGEGKNAMVVKALLPSVMMTALPTVSTSIPKEVQNIRKRALEFLLDTQTGEHSTFEGNNAMQLLLQHICVEIPEKAEYRHAAHATIGEIMAKLYCIPVPGKPREQQHAPRFISFLLKYGRHKRPIYRLFAAEVVEELLLNPTFLTPAEISVVLEKQQVKSKKSKKSSKKADLDNEGEEDTNDETLEKDGSMEPSTAEEGTSMDVDEDKTHAAANEDEDEKKKDETKTVVFSEQDHLEMVSSLASFILERSNDKIVNVRAKALSALASTIEFAISLESGKSTDPVVYNHYKKAIRKVYFGLEEATSSMDVSLTNEAPLATEAHDNASPIKKVSLVDLIRLRLQDERSTVRKSALMLLETLCRFDHLETLCPTLEMFKGACFDPLLIIRKQASSSLTTLLSNFENCVPLLHAWVQSVPVLAFDAEQSVQDAAVKAFSEVVVERVQNTMKKNVIDFECDPLAWTLFEMVTRCGSDANGRTIGKLFQMMSQSPETTKTARKFLKLLSVAADQVTATIKASEESMASAEVIENWRSLELAIWKSVSLLVGVPSFSSAIGLDFVLGNWEVVKNDVKVQVDTKLRMLHTVGSLVGEISMENAKKMSKDLLSRLLAFDVQPSMIQASTQILVKLTDRLSSETSGASVKAKADAAKENIRWMNELLQKTEQALSSIVVPSDQGIASESFKSYEQVEAMLFTAGEIAQFLDKKLLSGMVVTLLQSFISTTFKGVIVKRADEPSGTALLPVPASTRALAFISLGKLCLQDFTLAKTCIAAFARELEVSPSAVVRNNVMIVMCDLVVRYSNLVESYLSKLTICLRDENELVRRQTLLMMTNLLQEEFIKLRQGNLFYPLLLTLVDESDVLRQFAHICFDNILSKHGGASHVFFSNFIEAIFFLNDYRKHPSYNQFHYSARERQVFSLSGGGKNRASRFAIYKVFFDHMEEQHKYQVSFRICEEVLQSFLDGQIPLDETSTNLLYDVLCIMSSEEIRLKHTASRLAKGNTGDAKTSKDGLEALEEDEIGNSKNIEDQKKVIEATGQLAAQVVKKTMIERIVPIFIALKSMLAKLHSPLLKNVMDYLGDLVKDMPDEMADVLEHNPQLAMELAYETRLSHAISANKRKRRPHTADDEENVDNARDEAEGEISAFRAPKRAAATKRHAQPLSAAAGAPTPWKPKENPEIMGDFAVPKLRTGMTPYKPSPAQSRTEPKQTAEESPMKKAAAGVPQTPKTPKMAPIPLPPMTPGDISSPMANRMRRTSLVIRTPSSAAKQGQEKSLDFNFELPTSPSFARPPANRILNPSEEVPRNAKRPRYLEEDQEDVPKPTSPVGPREEDPVSPMAKKTRQKRPKVKEAADPDAMLEDIALSPARPSRPKRKK